MYWHQIVLFSNLQILLDDIEFRNIKKKYEFI